MNQIMYFIMSIYTIYIYIYLFHYICVVFLFLGASSCASAASWVISSVCLQIDKREVFGDQRSNRNSVKNCIFREKLIEIILKITAKSFSLVVSCHSSFIVLFYPLTRPEPPCTHLHPSLAVNSVFFLRIEHAWKLAVLLPMPPIRQSS